MCWHLTSFILQLSLWGSQSISGTLLDNLRGAPLKRFVNHISNLTLGILRPTRREQHPPKWTVPWQNHLCCSVTAVFMHYTRKLFLPKVIAQNFFVQSQNLHLRSNYLLFVNIFEFHFLIKSWLIVVHTFLSCLYTDNGVFICNHIGPFYSPRKDASLSE